MKPENIGLVIKKNLCTGCGTCVALCPSNSIVMKMNIQKGINIPEVDNKKCKLCGLCLSICPGKGLDFPKLYEGIFNYKKEPNLLGNYLYCYEGYSNDIEIRLNSSSGGLVTQTLIYALENQIIDGALVTKMYKDKTVAFIAHTRDEIIDASTSKYCPVSIDVALKEIVNSENSERFAVVGLPCHIQGMRNAASKIKNLDKRIVLYLGLFCAKGVSFLGSDYTFKKFNIKNENIIKLSYRTRGWPGKFFCCTTQEEIKVEKNYKDIYKKFSFFEPWRCNLCPDASCELGDISFGDAWLPRFMSSDKIGRSLLVTRTDTGAKIIKSMADQGHINLNPVSYEDVLKSQNDFIWKKRDLIARQKIAGIIGRQIPLNQCDNMYPNAPIKSYAISFVSFVLREIALNKRLWPILDVYHKIKD